MTALKFDPIRHKNTYKWQNIGLLGTFDMMIMFSDLLVPSKHIICTCGSRREGCHRLSVKVIDVMEKTVQVLMNTYRNEWKWNALDRKLLYAAS